MANVQEIIDAVKETTRRYDRDNFIISRVKMAIKHIHARDFFPMDREEIIIQNADLTLANSGTIGQFNMPLRWRAFEVLRPQDSANNLIGVKWQGITTQEIEKRRIENKDADTFYVAGQKVNFKSSVPVYQVLCSYFTVPNLTPDTAGGQTLADLSTWVTDEWEEAVHDLACSYLYSQIGNQELARSYMATYMNVHEPDILVSKSYASVQR